MNSSTVKKISFLQDYLRKNYSRFKNKYPNIIGAHVNQKTRNGVELRYYSIVFHVTIKGDQQNMIPKYLSIKLPNEGFKEIPTDIIVTEELEFESGTGQGSVVNSTNEDQNGSLGFFFKKDNKLFFCSNMHVLLKGYIIGKGSFYSKSSSSAKISASVSKGNRTIRGWVKRARYTSLLDFGYAQVIESDVNMASNYIPKLNQVICDYTDASHVAFKNENVLVNGALNTSESQIERTSVILEFNYSHMALDGRRIRFKQTFTDVGRLKRKITEKGDSGAPVIMNGKRLIGLVIGSTPSSTYYLNIKHIMKYLNYPLILNK